MSSASNSSSHKLLSSRSPNKEAGRISTRCLEEILLRLAKLREAFFFENEEEEEEETKERVVVVTVCCRSAVVVVMLLKRKAKRGVININNGERYLHKKESLF